MIACLLAAMVFIAIMLAVVRVPFRYSLRSLTVRWKTTLLTSLAFTLVISLVTVMLGFVNGMSRLLEGTGRQETVLVLDEGATDEVFSTLNPEAIADVEWLPQVVRDPESGRPLASRETYMVVSTPVPNTRQIERRFFQVRGVEDPLVAAAVHDVRLRDGGRWFSDGGIEHTPVEDCQGTQRTVIEAVLGPGAAQRLADYRTPTGGVGSRSHRRLNEGDRFSLGERTWIVTGIMDTANSAVSAEVWAKRSLVGSLFSEDGVTTLALRTRDAESARQCKDFLNREFQKARISAQVESDYYAEMIEMNQRLLMATIIVTSVTSIGGAISVMNTMYAAVSQRTYEIGLLRVLGYSRFQVLTCFLRESLMIGSAGGLLGCVLGAIANDLAATSVVSSPSGGGKYVDFRLWVSPETLACGMLLALIMCLLGGLLPALSAMRKRPLDAVGN